MELYLFVLIVLIILAISDLSVGVSNDAVNFLNSAIGAKAAPRYIIMAVASLGILIGTTFSSGLMEVARKGIFNPGQFSFHEIMLIFLAVMLTILLLLDLYNTFGLPTSTTVSIVFSLLGAAVSISIIKIYDTSENMADLINYINIGKATAIIFGILISVVVAFSAGAVVQFFTRLIFTFDVEKRIKRYGAIWGSISITLIFYFILFKGAKGTSFLTEGTITWLATHTELLMLISFIFFAFVLQLFISFTKFNIFKSVVLFGTFAIALSFAANDLVNFIGVPLAGLSAYKIAAGSGVADPSSLTMEALGKPVQTNTLLLLLAGAIMIVTIWFSSKAKTVTKTELSLGRQSEGFERFESSFFSRALVRMNMSMFDFIQKLTPLFIQKLIKKRLDPSAYKPVKSDSHSTPSFDLLRATVNLTVASTLISFATSLKLPLSTTYVTFMVAMGTSLSDKAWGRESAVYRVNGVITVIGGWFFTAFMAFTISAIFASIIFYGRVITIVALVILAGYIIFRTNILHKSREKEEEEFVKNKFEEATTGTGAIDAWLNEVGKFLGDVANTFTFTMSSLYDEDRVNLKKSKKTSKKMKKITTLLVSDIFQAVKLLDEDDLKGERRYGKIIASIQEVHTNLRNISQRCYEHIDNNHSKPSEEEIKDLNELVMMLNERIKVTREILAHRNFNDLAKFKTSVEKFETMVETLDEHEFDRIKHSTTSSRNSLLFLGILSDSENISNHITGLVNSMRKAFKGKSIKE